MAMTIVTDLMFTKAKSMSFPRQVVTGHDVLPQIGRMCKEFDLKGTALIVTGGTAFKLAAEPIHDILHEGGYEVQFAEVGPATMDNVKKVEKVAKEVKASFLLGVGGGSKIDIAKKVASDCTIPFISVPTAASHDGIASPRASIKDGISPVSIDAKVPLGVLADTGIILRSPYRLLASGCADVISNATAVLDWELAERLRHEEFSSSAAAVASYTAEAMISSADAIKPNLEESVWLAIKPMIVSGIAMSVAGSSRPTSGSEHMFSHALDQLAPGKALHGEQCGIGAIMMMYLHGGDWKRIRDALQKVGAPTAAKDVGITKTQVIDALIKAHTIRPERYTILGDKGLTFEAAEKLAIATKVV